MSKSVDHFRAGGRIHTITEGVTLRVHVDIGVVYNILGPVAIGDHAKIGANAVVIYIPADGVAVGVPARVPVGGHELTVWFRTVSDGCASWPSPPVIWHSIYLVFYTLWTD